MAEVKLCAGMQAVTMLTVGIVSLSPMKEVWFEPVSLERECTQDHVLRD